MNLCPNCFSSKSFQHNLCVVCGFSNTVKRDIRALPVETLLNHRYIVGRILGIGGFGITYVVYDVERRERLAAKEYFPTEWAVRTPPNNHIIPNSQAKDALYQHGQEVFVNEARVLSKLKNVSNVVNVEDFFVENGTAYMIMELLDGYTLSGYLKYRGTKKMPYQMAGKIVTNVGYALHQVHAHMLLHRDVGPDNIMITNNNEVKLIDFGATRMYALNSPKSMSILVKPGFAPIEQYSRAGNQGPWTDVYALAATYYYLVTGSKPPEAPDRIAGSMLLPLKTVIPAIPEYISTAIEHALSENWRNRPQSIRDFLLEMRLMPKQSDIKRTIWVWQSEQDAQKQYISKDEYRKNKPCVLMQVGNQRTRYYFIRDNTLAIGRNAERNNIVLNDSQVSSFHCKLWFDGEGGRFMIENYSSNCTYTSQGLLEKGQGTYLVRGEWIYIQTKRERYIFYLEVE